MLKKKKVGLKPKITYVVQTSVCVCVCDYRTNSVRRSWCFWHSEVFLWFLSAADFRSVCVKSFFTFFFFFFHSQTDDDFVLT